jgi:hypothetical protein
MNQLVFGAEKQSLSAQCLEVNVGYFCHEKQEFFFLELAEETQTDLHLRVIIALRMQQ